MLRNCCVSAGNQGSEEHVPALAQCLREDGSPLVRGHAAWALGRIGGVEAVTALEAELAVENDGWVLEETRLALEDAEPAARDGKIE
jgi:epoxyqueuosine reductase